MADERSEQIARSQAALLAHIEAVRQRNLLSVPIPTPPTAFDLARKAKCDEIKAWYAGKLVLGLDTGLGFSIRIADTDQHTFAAYKVMLDAAVQQGVRSVESQVILADVNEAPFEITVEQFNNLVCAYGQYCEAVFQQYTLAKIHLARATTLAEVAAITLT